MAHVKNARMGFVTGYNYGKKPKNHKKVRRESNKRYNEIRSYLG